MLVKGETLFIPTIFTHFQVSGQGDFRQCSRSDIDIPSMVTAAMAGHDPPSLGVPYIPSTSETSSVPALADHQYSSSFGKELDVVCRGTFCQSQETHGFPPEITHIIEDGLRPNTKKSYKGVHSRWLLFACAKSFNPYMPSVKNVLSYLYHIHVVSKLSAITLLRHKVALKWIVNSSFHPVIDNILVYHFITGIFNRNPPPPKPVTDIWDVNVVLSYLDKLPPTQHLPLMLLTMKTILLVLISTMRRRADVIQIRRDNILFLPNAISFPLDIFPKTYTLTNRVEDLRFVTLKTFPQNKNLCPVHTIQYYIRKTAVFTDSKKVFIITQSPFSAASDMTIRRWILRGLVQAGIDVDKWGASSTRHASWSKAYHAGVNVDLLLKCAGWVNLSTFILHYNLPVVQQNASKLSSLTSAVHSSHKPVSSAILASCLQQGKTAAWARAFQVVNSARRFRATARAKVEMAAFISPPPKVHKKKLPRFVNVRIPTKTHTGRTCKKPYVIRTNVVNLPPHVSSGSETE